MNSGQDMAAMLGYSQQKKESFVSRTNIVAIVFYVSWDCVKILYCFRQKRLTKMSFKKTQLSYIT